MDAAAARVREALRVAGAGLVEREGLVELIALAAVAREHLLVIGPPGTAKSEAVRRVSTALGGAYFEYLLGRFTEPNELFGPVDLRKLRDGVVQTRTEGMLPEAQLAFLDEVFLGSTAILNALLGMLAERRFRRGHTVLDCPLRVCVGASNALPEDPALAAFADRFVLRIFIRPVPDSLLEDLLLGGAGLRPLTSPVASVADLDALSGAARAADLAPVRPLLAQVVRTLRGEGIALSDRRVVKLQRLVAAAAVLGGRPTPTPADLWPVVYAVPTADEQQLARDALRELLADAENATLTAAAEEASLGPLARAARIAERARAVLDNTAGESPAVHRLRVEGVLREIDAGFAPDGLPDVLVELRPRLVTAAESATSPPAP